MNPTSCWRPARAFLCRTFGVICLLAVPGGAVASPILIGATVPGRANLWLAAQPAGTTTPYGDSVPNESPVEVGGLVAGMRLTIAATGLVDHCSGAGCGLAGPDGDPAEGNTTHLQGSLHRISDLLTPIDSLIGVFLGPAGPVAPAPASLSFGTAAARDFGLLLPAVQQSFFIGDGRTSAGAWQTFVVPTGATRLFLGTMDGYGWFTNVGEFDVTVRPADVPEPALTLLALAGIGAAALRRRHA